MKLCIGQVTTLWPLNSFSGIFCSRQNSVPKNTDGPPATFPSWDSTVIDHSSHLLSTKYMCTDVNQKNCSKLDSLQKVITFCTNKSAGKLMTLETRTA